jgi:hypothetical protein
MYPLKDCESLHERTRVRAADPSVMLKPTLGAWRWRRVKRRERSASPSLIKTPRTTHEGISSGGSGSRAKDKSRGVRSLDRPEAAWLGKRTRSGTGRQ